MAGVRVALAALLGGGALFAAAALARAQGAALPQRAPAMLLALTLAGGLAGLAAGVRRRMHTATGALDGGEWSAILVLLALAFVALSLGPTIRVGGVEVGPGLYRPVYEALPFLRAVRVLTRFGVVFLLATGLLASLGAATLLARTPPRWRAAAAALLAAAALMEYWPAGLAYEPYRWPPEAAVYRTIRARPAAEAVLELPTAALRPDAHDPRDAAAMLRALYHRHPVVNGVSGFIPPLTTRIANALAVQTPATFPDEDLLAALRSVYPLRWLVVHPSEMHAAEQALWRRARAGEIAALRPVLTGADPELYELQRLPEVGRTISRYVGRELLRRRPVLVLTLALEGAGPPADARGRPDRRATATADVEIIDATLEVRFNGVLRERLGLGEEPATLRLPAPKPWYRAAANRLDLSLAYRVRDGAADPAYLLGDRTLPMDVYVRVDGSGGVVAIDGSDRRLARGAHYLLLLDPGAGTGRAIEAFPLERRPRAAHRLRRMVRELAAGTPVLYVGAGPIPEQAQPLLAEALSMLGGPAAGTSGPAPVALLGRRGDPPGTARMRTGTERVELLHGHDPRRWRLRLTAFELRSPD